VQHELQKRVAMVEKEREGIRAEEGVEKLRIEQAKLTAATAHLSARMQAWPQQVKIAQKPRRARVNSDVGRIWPNEDASEWDRRDAGR